MKIVLAPLAAQDLQEAYAFIAGDNPDAADRALAGILEAFGLLASGRVQVRQV